MPRTAVKVAPHLYLSIMDSSALCSESRVKIIHVNMIAVGIGTTPCSIDLAYWGVGSLVLGLEDTINAEPV